MNFISSKLELCQSCRIYICINLYFSLWEFLLEIIQDFHTSPKLLRSSCYWSIIRTMLIQANRSERCNSNELQSFCILLLILFFNFPNKNCYFFQSLIWILICDSTFSINYCKIYYLSFFISNRSCCSYIVVGSSKFDSNIYFRTCRSLESRQRRILHYLYIQDLYKRYDFIN